MKTYLVFIPFLFAILSAACQPVPVPPTPVQQDYRHINSWRESTPDEQGMDSEHFKLLREHIKENLPHMRSVLVIRHGYLVFEEYYQGVPNDYQDLASATKSIISALIGVALQEGYIKSLDQKVVNFYPEYISPKPDPQISDVTLEHLLTMTSGLERETNYSEDWIKSTLEQSISGTSGKAFHYNDSAAHLLSGILTRTTHMTALEFGNQYLFQPLGIPLPPWKTDPQGNNVGGDGMSLRPREMAKIGYLYLNQGFWDGQSLMPAEWVRASTQKHSDADILNDDYGYLWWVTTVEGHAAYYAAGFGGQFIYVVPDLDLVVVMTGNASFPELLQHLDIVRLYIVPATLE